MKTQIIAERIKELRTEYHLSQEKLGDMLAVSQDTISLWENNKALPNIEYVILMCNIFQISADYLLGLKD